MLFKICQLSHNHIFIMGCNPLFIGLHRLELQMYNSRVSSRACGALVTVEGKTSSAFKQGKIFLGGGGVGQETTAQGKHTPTTLKKPRSTKRREGRGRFARTPSPNHRQRFGCVCRKLVEVFAALSGISLS